MTRTMTSWSPFADLADLHTRIDEMFGELGNGEKRQWKPAIDVIDGEGKITIRADMPGLTPDDVKIEVSDDVLTISGEHEERKEEKDERYVRRERRYGSFSRSIPLPAGVKPKDVEATSKDGTVEITVPLPKGEEKKPVQIKPKAAS